MLHVLVLSVALLFAGGWLGPSAAWAQANKSALAGAKIDINSATEAELEKLPAWVRRRPRRSSRAGPISR